MKRKKYTFEVSKERSDEILEKFAILGFSNFYSEREPHSTNEVFHIFLENDDRAREILNVLNVKAKKAYIEDQDWISKWSESLKIIKVDEGLYVNPNPTKFTDPTDGITVKIVPEMAFGTGEHPTTKLAIRLLRKTIIPSMSVCDVGCGTGILSIFAVKLGAKHVLAVDIDDNAIESAKNTRKLNNANFEIRKSDLLTQVHEKFDLIVSNIVLDVIIKLTAQFGKNQKAVVSGIDSERALQFENFCHQKGIKIVEKMCEDGWCAYRIV